MSQATAVPPKVQLGAPEAPETVEETGIRHAILEDLALKILCVAGPLSLRELSDQIRLQFSVVNELLRRLRAEQLCEVTGMHANIPQVAITSAGRSRAIELLSLKSAITPVLLPGLAGELRKTSSAAKACVSTPKFTRLTCSAHSLIW